MKAKFSIIILWEAYLQACELNKDVSYNFDDYTNVMSWEEE